MNIIETVMSGIRNRFFNTPTQVGHWTHATPPTSLDYVNGMIDTRRERQLLEQIEEHEDQFIYDGGMDLFTPEQESGVLDNALREVVTALGDYTDPPERGVLTMNELRERIQRRHPSKPLKREERFGATFNKI